MKVLCFRLDTITSEKISEVNIGDIYLIISPKEFILCQCFDETQKALLNKGEIVKCYSWQIDKVKYPDNTLIYFCDGIQRRTGDLSFLGYIIETLNNDSLKQVFKNLLDILLYKEDRIDFVSLLQIDILPKELIKVPILLNRNANNIITSTKNESVSVKEECQHFNQMHDLSTTVYIYPPKDYYFFDYLRSDAQNMWIELYNKKMKQRDIYKSIKRNDPLGFKASFTRFIRENPELDLYSHNKNKLEFKEQYDRIKDLKFLYQSLEDHGFIQIADNKWKNHDGFVFEINIKPVK